MDNSQHWYVPKDRKAITSERMVSEIVMMNKLEIKAELKYLQSGAMCWMVYLPVDEVCKEQWCIALIYNKDFSMSGCKEPFVTMLAKPKSEELIAAIKKGGKMEPNIVIPINPEGKSDMTCIEAVENLIKWRKSIYPLLDFTPDEDPMQEENPNVSEFAVEAEPVRAIVYGVMSEPEKEQQTVGAVDEPQWNQQDLINNIDITDVIVGSGDQSTNVNSGAVILDSHEDVLFTDLPDKIEEKSCSTVSENLDDENNDECGNFVIDVSLSE